MDVYVLSTADVLAVNLHEVGGVELRDLQVEVTLVTVAIFNTINLLEIVYVGHLQNTVFSQALHRVLLALLRVSDLRDFGFFLYDSGRMSVGCCGTEQKLAILVFHIEVGDPG